MIGLRSADWATWIGLGLARTRGAAQGVRIELAQKVAKLHALVAQTRGRLGSVALGVLDDPAHLARLQLRHPRDRSPLHEKKEVECG